MAHIGIHVSSAGGIIKTFERAELVGAQCFQFFLRSPRAWAWKGISEEEKQEFKRLREKLAFPLMVHAPYLLNLASADESLRKKSMEVFLEELKTCDELKIDFYNFHPGIAKGISDEEALKRVIKSLEEVFSQYEPKFTTLLFENTAGERGDLGKSFQELWLLLSAFDGLKVGVCLDTCHAFAYGYDIRTERTFEDFKSHVDRVLSLERIRAIHSNDSKTPLGSKKDRHEHIGLGHIGLKAFELFLKDDYFGNLPYYLETPKVDDWDVKNIRTLKSLL